MYDVNNIFAKIIRKEVPAKIVYEDDNILAFEDINKKAKVHVLVVPKKNFISYHDFIKGSSDAEISSFFKTIDKIADQLGISDSYRVMSNHGSLMGQVVFHFHVHLFGGGLIIK